MPPRTVGLSQYDTILSTVPAKADAGRSNARAAKATRRAKVMVSLRGTPARRRGHILLVVDDGGLPLAVEVREESNRGPRRRTAPFVLNVT